jgi:bacillithiol biosynthesis deacetylase BshB1
MTTPSTNPGGAMLRVLVIAPHPDDAEIGMGGTIALLAAKGHEVTICDLTDGSPTPRGERAERLAEAQAALECLQPREGGTRIRRILLDLPNRTLLHTIESRHRVAGVIRAVQADVLFIPHWDDAHPDHVAATRIAEDARFDAKLTRIDMPSPPGFVGAGPPIYPRWVFYYDVSHLRAVLSPLFCIDITGFEQAKIASVRAYRSQFGPWEGESPVNRPGALVRSDLPDHLLTLAGVYGRTIGADYAEPFFTREPLGLRGLEWLVR